MAADDLIKRICKQTVISKKINGASFFNVRSPSPLGQPPRSTTVRINSDDPPPNGVIPMVPMFEVQSLTMQLGPENKDFHVEGVNTTSNDAIFASDNKVYSFFIIVFSFACAERRSLNLAVYNRPDFLDNWHDRDGLGNQHIYL